MQYVLKNKDKEIVKFEVVEKIKEFESGKGIVEAIVNIEVINELPHFLIHTDDIANNLKLFIENRKVPQNRAFVENIIATYSTGGKEMLMDYIDVSLGLSLNDSYWIIPSSKNYKWKDYNLYDNEFSEALQRASFGEELLKIKGFASSPEYTTNGMLKKCWHRENGEIYLYKANSNGGKEAYAEYYMSQIAEVMEFDYVPYELKMFHNQLVSSCPIFTNENEGFVPMYQFLDEKFYKIKGLELIEEITKIYSNEHFIDLMLFDALICNTDRHLGNFGMIVDNDTGEILRPAPIFDNGYSMLNLMKYPQDEWFFKKSMTKSSWFDLSFEEQLYRFARKKHTINLEKLTNFTFKRHEQYNLSNEWLESIEKCIQQRAKKALEFIEEKSLNRNMQQEQDSTPKTHKAKRRR